MDGLPPFVPLPVLAPPPAATPTPVAGSGAERAQAAALAERLLSQVRVGRVGDDGHAVHLRLSEGSLFGGLSIQLTHERGALAARILAPPGGLALGDRLARAVARELEARGVSLAEVEVELG